MPLTMESEIQVLLKMNREFSRWNPDSKAWSLKSSYPYMGARLHASDTTASRASRNSSCARFETCSPTVHLETRLTRLTFQEE